VTTPWANLHHRRAAARSRLSTRHEEIIQDLQADRSELIGISQACKDELVAQQLSDSDLKYIIENVVPTLRRTAEQAIADAKDDTAEKVTTQMRDALKSLEPMLSIHTLTILQLLGFNFKRASGEPLTLWSAETDYLKSHPRPADPSRDQ
jgi:hypothetical protein